MNPRLGNASTPHAFLVSVPISGTNSGHTLFHALPAGGRRPTSAALPLATDHHLRGDGARGPHGPEAPPCDTPAPAPATLAACEGPRGQKDVNVPRAPSRTPPPRGIARGAGRHRCRLAAAGPVGATLRPDSAGWERAISVTFLTSIVGNGPRRREYGGVIGDTLKIQLGLKLFDFLIESAVFQIITF